MENVVLKANRYRIVDNSAFEMPLPLKFTVWKCEAPICEYLVSEDEVYPIPSSPASRS